MATSSAPPPIRGFTFQYVYAAEVLALGFTLPIVCMLLVGLRFAARRLQKRSVGIDDWFSVLGLVFVVGCSACMIAGALTGVMGYPTPARPTDLTPEEAELYIDPSTDLLQKLEFPFQIFMICAYGFIKLSIVYFYRRLFVVHQRSPFDIITKITVVILILWTIAFILLIVFPCGTHVWANWSSKYWQLQYCPIGFSSEYAIAGSDLALDFIVILMPIPLVWKLRLTTRQKLAVTGILLLGASSIGASIARLELYIELLAAETSEVVIDRDLVLTVSLYWSLLEAGLALIAACLPTLSYLITTQGLQSALRSVQSKLSLHSTTSLHEIKHDTEKPPARYEIKQTNQVDVVSMPRYSEGSGQDGSHC